MCWHTSASNDDASINLSLRVSVHDKQAWSIWVEIIKYTVHTHVCAIPTSLTVTFISLFIWIEMQYKSGVPDLQILRHKIYCLFALKERVCMFVENQSLSNLGNVMKREEKRKKWKSIQGNMLRNV